MTVAGILLAAGGGSRLGQPKALVELDGRTLADRGVAILRDGGAAPVLVISGAVPVSVPGARTVHNPEWRTGMGSSLAVGLRVLTPQRDLTTQRTPDGKKLPGVAPGGEPGDRAGDRAEAVVIALADQPLVGAAAVRRLIAAYRGGAGVAVAAYGGKPRNPVLIARQHWPAVLAMAVGDAGARPFLRANPDLVTVVECGDTGRPDDIDTVEDLTRITGR